MKNVVIGITDCAKYSHYEKWIAQEPAVKVIKLSYHEDNLNDMQNCDGLIFTGGHDVNPRLYRQPDFLAYCDPKNIDEKRDEFVGKVMQHVVEMQLPVLGICRGLQFVNVYYGGTLVPDIPSFGKFNHSKLEEGKDRVHAIEIDKNSVLYKVVGEAGGEINSAHHQSADMPGYGLVANAMSPDGVIEGMERKDSQGKPFLILIQWHPERMTNQESILSKKIKKAFLDAVRENTQ
jgi:putative glutamine amidotransferase